MGAVALTALLIAAVASVVGPTGTAYAVTGPTAAQPAASPASAPVRTSTPAEPTSPATGPTGTAGTPQQPAPHRATPKAAPKSAKKPTAPPATQVKALRAKASVAAADAAPAADTDSSDCGGPLDFDTLHACASIAPGGSDTYTLTTTTANDLLTVQLTGSGDATVTGQLSGPDGIVENCSILGWSSPANCVTGTAGTYHLVINNAFGTSGYTLTVSSLHSSPCPTVTEADLAFGAAPLTGSIAAGGASSCYALDSAAAASGDLLRMGGLSYELQATVYDAASTQVCVVGYYRDTCTLSGDGPYRMLLQDTYAQAFAYTVTVTRVSRPNGCATLAPAPFGDPGQAVASGSLPIGAVQCRTVALPDGPANVSVEHGSSTSGSMSWTLYAAEGEEACSGTDDTTCNALPGAGTYTLLLENTSIFETADYAVAVIPLTGTAGCAASVGTSYDLPLLHVTLTSALQTDCQPFNGTPGERIDLTTSTDVYGTINTTIVDPSGTPSCSRDNGDGPTQDGCVLNGTGPYRAVTRAAYDFTGTYTMRIARLSQPAGCTALPPQEFGKAPTASLNPCWLLQVPAAGTYDVGGTQVYHQDGTRLCQGDALCTFPAAGTYPLVFRPSYLSATPVAPVFISPTETRGCASAPDTGFASGPQIAAPFALGQRDCLLLPTPSGNGLYLVSAGVDSGADPVETVYDAKGVQQCQNSYSFGVCKLTGTAPFHLVMAAFSADTFRLTVQRTGATTGCTAWPQSAFGGTYGARVPLTSTQQTVCLALPAGGHSTAEMFDFTNTTNSLNASLQVYDAAGDQVCNTLGTSTTTCKLTAGVGYAAVLIGTGTADTYDVVHRDVSSTATCSTPASLAMGGPSTGFTFTSALDARCVHVAAAAGDKMWFSERTRADDSGAELLVLDASGARVCWQHGVACRVTGSTAYVVVVVASGYSGTPIAVHVDTWRAGTASGWAPQCAANTLSPGGFPLRSGKLTETSTAYCAVMQVKPSQAFYVYGTDSDPTRSTPSVNMFSSANWNGTSIDYAYQCGGTNVGDFSFRCSTNGSPATQVLFVLSPSQATTPVEYSMQGVCSSQCATPPAAADLSSLTPASGPAETGNQVVIRGSHLTLGTEVDLARDGSVVDGSWASPVSVSADGTSLTVLLGSYGLALGKYDVVLDRAGYTTGTRSPGYLPGGYTLTAAAAPARSRLVPTTPTRFLDTRSGTGAPKARVGAGGVVKLQVAGAHGIPATGVTAVVMNVTAVNPSAAGFVTVYPDGGSVPSVSNINFRAGQTIPNLVTVPVTNGKVDLRNTFGTVDLVADVTGYYTSADAGSGLMPLTPTRVLDTRSGTGAPKARVGAGGVVKLQVAGAHGIPATGVTAVVMNVTAVNPSTSGVVTAYPDGQPVPQASNLNFTAGETIANLVVVPVTNGKVDLRNSFGTVDLVADVTGYFTSAGSAFSAAGPVRLLDTRSGLGARAGVVGPGGELSIAIAGVGGIPNDNVTAVVLNVTATAPTAAGFLTVYPHGQSVPGASNLNFTAGETISNLVVVPVVDGRVSFTNHSGNVQVVADLAGYYSTA